MIVLDIAGWVMLAAALCLLSVAGYYAKEIPKIHRDYLHDIRELRQNMIRDEKQYSNNHQLQIESYFREQGGEDLKRLFLEWTEMLFDLDKMKEMNSSKLISLQERTVVYGSDRTVRLVSNFHQTMYKNEAVGKKDSKEDNNSTLVVYVAMIICSLKKDFTGFDIEPQSLLKIKLNDYDEQSDFVDEAVNKIKEEVDWK